MFPTKKYTTFTLHVNIQDTRVLRMLTAVPHAVPSYALAYQMLFLLPVTAC